MSEKRHRVSTLILSRSWGDTNSELSFAIRSLAGAASRSGGVTVCVPGVPDHAVPDGGFDVFGIGKGVTESWPAPEDATWPAPNDGITAVIVDQMDDSCRAILRRSFPSQRAYFLSAKGNRVADHDVLREGPRSEQLPLTVGIHVPVSPLARLHRHTGLGFTGYLLVLSDRVGPVEDSAPTQLVAWLTARYFKSHVVVIENAQASVWKGRALRGRINVESRTDLQRLIAHARVMIDLAPGAVIARECIESLRLGTPILVPAGSAGDLHARRGGMSFSDGPACLAQVELLMDDALLQSVTTDGREYADATFGESGLAVISLGAILAPST